MTIALARIDVASSMIALGACPGLILITWPVTR